MNLNTSFVISVNSSLILFIFTGGCRNISNCLTIGTQIDLMSKDLKSHAESNGYWDPSQGDLNFAEAYGNANENATQRLNRGKELLTTLSESGNNKYIYIGLQQK